MHFVQKKKKRNEREKRNCPTKLILIDLFEEKNIFKIKFKWIMIIEHCTVSHSINNKKF